VSRVSVRPTPVAGAAARPRVTAERRLTLARGHERLVLGVAGCVLLLAVWEASVRLGFVRALFVSSPSGVARSAAVAVGQGAFWADVSVTLVEFSLGYLSAAVAGIALGLVAGWYPRVNHLASPWIAAWYATPQVAFVPLAILWFGIGLGYKVFYVFLVSFFTVAVSTIAGVEAAEATHVDVARSFGARQITLFRTVVLPSAVPHIVTGLRLAAGRAWVGVVIAELVGANQGLGFMVNLAGSLLDTDRAMLGIVLLGLFGVAWNEGLRRIERRFDAWRPRVADSAVADNSGGSL